MGQLLRYLALILDIQKRVKIYGFLTNIKFMKFFYVTKDPHSSLCHYYQSNDKLEMITGLPKPSSSSSSSSTSSKASDKQPEEYHFHRDAWSIFIKFLTMNWNFYEYTTLNIKPDDYLYADRFNIQTRIGNGLTSMVYLLEKNVDNLSTIDRKSLILKISKEDRYTEYLKNEYEILKMLKQSNNSQKFDLFFEDVFEKSPTGNFLLFQNYLNSMKSLEITESGQLIDIIQYLYNCNIIHRDLRPENLMYDSNRKHLKLIDFGFAAIFENGEMIKSLPIGGTISYAGLKFLKFYSNLSFNIGISEYYEYERTFDLECALNVIMFMTDSMIANNINLIREESLNVVYKSEKLYQFWCDTKKNNNGYTQVLNLINNLKQASEFESIKNAIKNLLILNNQKVHDS